MAKNTKPAATATFVIGDRVFAQTAATLHQCATGTITDISKSGWYIIELDDSNASDVLANTKGKISARISSMEHICEAPAPKAGGFAAQLAAANAPAPAKEVKAKQTPKPKTPKQELPTICPECGGKLEENKDEEGNTILTCADDECGWEETYPADTDVAGRMAEALKKARAHYEKTRRPEGTASADCADLIAKELRDYEPQDVANLADKVLNQPAGFHYGKYQHLNNGQIRMNSGNRIRAYWKQINEDNNEAEIARVGKLLNLIETE